MQKELTVVKVNEINEETFDAVTRNLRNKLCYGGPHNMRHILVHYLQKELCVLCIDLLLIEETIDGRIEYSSCSAMTEM